MFCIKKEKIHKKLCKQDFACYTIEFSQTNLIVDASIKSKKKVLCDRL